MLVKKEGELAAPCGLYCGACMIYRANKRGDAKFLTQIRERFAKIFSALERGQRPPGMPPSTKEKDFDFTGFREDMRGDLDINCEGCLSSVLGLPCRDCGFRDCSQRKGLTNCSQCSAAPCKLLVDFSNDGVPHHSEVLNTIKRQKEIGIDAWLSEQEERWRCIQCGSPLAWYDAKCPECNATPGQTFGSFPLSD